MEKTWKNVELYKKHHKISKRASYIIDNYEKQDTELWKLLHHEHIVPVKVTKNKLIELGFNPKLEDIEEIMNESEVVILSKEEANVLDGSKEKKFMLDDTLVEGKGLSRSGTKEERLNAIGAILDKRYLNNEI